MDTEEVEEVAVQTVYVVDGDGPFGFTAGKWGDSTNGD